MKTKKGNFLKLIELIPTTTNNYRKMSIPYCIEKRGRMNPRDRNEDEGYRMKQKKCSEIVITMSLLRFDERKILVNLWVKCGVLI